MKYLDFSSLLAGDPVEIAFLSTFQFDPEFFERRLLHCRSLSNARRIAVFMDARQWFELLRPDLPVRGLNRQYLVVPVRRHQGVFHPKLSLLLGESSGQVLCGSNNLTRSGCSSNLELLNAIPFEINESFSAEMNLAREAFTFFSHAAKNTDAEISRIALEWLQETASDFPWLKEPVGDESQRTIRLVHTYDGAIWDRLVSHLNGSKPRHFFVAAPFHDANGEMARRIAEQWPQSQLELLVQPGYTTLAVKPLRKLSKVRLSELRNASRRLHAKIVAWRTESSSGCLVGSANFTTAAFDGRNVETCLLVSQSGDLVDALFDRSLSKQPLNFDEFVPGDEESPENEITLPPLRIDSAVLIAEDRLRITYTCQLAPQPDTLRLSIYAAGEVHPHVTMEIQNKVGGKQTVTLPDELFAESHGILLASLSVDVKGERLESRPLWIIQESRLTHEPGEGSSSANDKIEVSGQGLPEFLDELGKQKNGLRMVVEFLRSLKIRFYDGSAGGFRRRGFNLKIHDPFHADAVPGWLMEAGAESENLELAIDAFIERHERRRLLKHASRGNINGMENFLDIFRAMVRLLYVYYRRRVVNKSALIARLRTFIELATIGRRALGEHSEKDSFNGYLSSVSENLSGDRQLLQKVCDETNYVADVVAVLLIAQSVRFDPKEEVKDGPPPLRPREVLPYYAQAIQTAIARCQLKKADPSQRSPSIGRLSHVF